MKLPAGWKSRASWNGHELIHDGLIVGAVGPWQHDSRLLAADVYAYGRAIFNDEARAIDWLIATATKILEGHREPRTLGALDLPPDAVIAPDYRARVHLTAEQRREAARLLKVGRAEARRLGILNGSIERDIAHREMTGSFFERDAEADEAARAAGRPIKGDRTSHSTWDEFVVGPRRWSEGQDIEVDEDLLDTPEELAAFSSRASELQARFAAELRARLTQTELEHWQRLEAGQSQAEIAGWLHLSRSRIAQLETRLRRLVDEAHQSVFEGRPYPFRQRRAGVRGRSR